MNKDGMAAQGPLDRGVRAQAWIRRHKNDDPNDGHLYIDTFKEDAEKWLSQFKAGYAWLEPLASVESLAKQWEAMHGFDKHGVAAWLRSNCASERPSACGRSARLESSATQLTEKDE